MEKVNRFVAKHFWAVFISLTIAVVLLYFTMLSGTTMPGVLYIGFLGAMLLVSCLCVQSSVVLLNKAYRELEDHCDPEPFLQEARQQLSYPGSKMMKLTRIVNTTTALMEMGDHTEAYDMLVKIRDDIQHCIRFDVQTVCYNNLTVCCTVLNKWPEAEIWHGKMLESLQKIKFEKTREKFKNPIILYSANEYYRKQDYMQAMRMLDGIHAQSLRLRVHLAAHYGKLYLAQGETEKAREALTFAAEKGNKLYLATQAREMLLAMEENTFA